MSTPAVVNQAVVSDPVNAAMEAFKSGSDIEKAVYGTPSKSATPSAPTSQDPVTEQAGEQDEQNASPASSLEDSTKENAEEKAPLLSEEEIIVTDDAGARRRLKVSYSDREKIKKAYEMAAGMRKAFSERDQVKNHLASIEAEHKDLKSSWGALEEAFGKQGIAGVINLLGGKNDAFEHFMNAEVDKRNRYAIASPEEKRHYDLEKQLDNERQERQRLQQSIEQNLKQAETSRKTAEQKQAESVLHPTFEKYRFTGKLGDGGLETQLDSAVWTQAREKLLETPDNVEITPAMIDKAFRETANTFRKAIDKQASAKVQHTVAKRKEAAQEAAAAAVQGGNKAGVSSQQAIAAHMKTSDFGGLFRDVFSGKIKL